MSSSPDPAPTLTSPASYSSPEAPSNRAGSTRQRNGSSRQRPSSRSRSRSRSRRSCCLSSMVNGTSCQGCFDSFCAYDKPDYAGPSLTFQPYSARRCTNLGWLAFFICFLTGVMVIMGRAAVKGGDPYRVINGVDWMGRICGHSANVTSKPYSAWIVMPNILNPFASDCSGCADFKVCVADCGETLLEPWVMDKYLSEPFLYSCVPVPPGSVKARGFNQSFVPQFPYASEFNSLTQLASRSYTDLFIGWPVVLTSSVLAIIFSYIYAWTATKWVKALLAFLICLVVSGGFLVSFTLLKNGADIAGSVSPERRLAVEALGWTVVAMTLLLIAMVYIFRHRIAIATEVLREAMVAALHMPYAIFYPAILFIVGIGCFVVFVTGVLLVASAWDTSFVFPWPDYVLERGAALGIPEFASRTQPHFVWTNDANLMKCFSYLILYAIFVTHVLSYFVYTVLSAAVSRWYFLPRIPDEEKKGVLKRIVPRFPLFDASMLVLRYHMGTVIFGAFVVSMLEWMRLAFDYLERVRCIRAEAAPGTCQHCLGRCLAVMSKCSRCCLDNINKQTLIWVALYGDDFAMASTRVCSLLSQNLIRYGTVTVVGTALLFFGKIVVATLTAGVGGIIILQTYGTVLNSSVLPVVTIFLIAYMVASVIMVTLHSIIDTVFICFLVDEQINGPHNMIANNKLKAVLWKQRDEAQSAYDRAVQQQQQQI